MHHTFTEPLLRRPRRRRTLLAVSLMLLAACNHVEMEPSPSTPSSTALPVERLQQVVDDFAMAAVDVTTCGVSVGVLRLADGARWTSAAGMASDSEPLTPDTVVEVGSITKQMTAAMVLVAQEEGRLHVDDDAGSHLPAFASLLEGVTVHHLLTHSSGLVDYLYLPAFASDRERPWTTTEMAQLLDGEPRLFEAGAHVSYSNTNYLLLGMVLESAYDAPFVDVVDTVLLQGVGLPATGVCDAHEQTTPRAQGHVEGSEVDSVDMSQPHAAGAMCSTVENLLTWTAAVASRMLHDVDVTEPSRLSSGTPLLYTAGLQLGRLRGHDTLMHHGVIRGFTATTTTLLDDGWVVVAVANDGTVQWAALEEALAAVVLDDDGNNNDETNDDDEAPASLVDAAGLYVDLAPPSESTARLRLVVDDDGEAEVTIDGSTFWPLTPTSRGHEAVLGDGLPLRVVVVDGHLEVERHGRLRWMWPAP